MICLSALLTTGCRSDDPINIGGDGTTSLKLLIPSATMTRATEVNIEAKEGAVNKLYVVGFYDYRDEIPQKHFIEEIHPEAGVAIDGVYRSFSFNVEPSTYNLYLIGNMNLKADMLTELEGENTANDLETRVRDLQHDYEGGLPEYTKGLPMSGLKSELKVVKGSVTEAKVDLEFLCAKVRLTVIHEDELGRAGLKVESTSASNLYQPVNIFTTGTKTQYGTKYNISSNVAAISAHYPIGDLKGKSVDELLTRPADPAQDLIELLSKTTALTASELATSLENAYQGVIYVPESGIVSDANATTINAVMGTGSDSKTFNFKIGNGGKIDRGHFYEVIAKVRGGDLEYSWSVKDWGTPTDIAIRLAGKSELYLAETTISKIDGENPAIIRYMSNVPELSFESDRGPSNKDLFSFKEDKEEGTIEVSLNPDYPFSTTTLSNQGFWVISGSIRKRVTVQTVDPRAFVRISPEARSLNIAQIINSDKYQLWFEYSTNMDNLSINLGSYVNTNTNKETKNIKLCVYTGSEEEPEQYSKEAKLVNGMSISGLEKAAGVTGEFPKSGLICITLSDPGDVTAFGNRISGSINANATASGAAAQSKSGKFTVNPNSDTFTIHFKVINAEWNEPHCYVYQPLTYNDYYVFDQKGELNWVEYSFTGKMAFKGWASNYGSVTDPSGLQDVTQGGKTFKAYKEWQQSAETFPDDKYYKDVDLIADYREELYEHNRTCAEDDKITCACKDGSNSLRWPGVAMIPEENGWYKLVLPKLAEPGKALIMFAEKHDENEGNGRGRYPADKQPGIPMPNFASGEGWYLFDASNRDNCSFADFERNSY